MAVEEKTNLKNMKQLKILIMLCYAVIVAAAVLTVSVLAVHKTDQVLEKKVSTLTTALNVQMELNLNNYLRRMETIGTLAFAEEQTYKYDATDPANDEYEATLTETAIRDKLYSLCIMENFVDYGVVYRNNHCVGKISNGTVDLFGERMFQDLEAMITRPRTNDGWAAGYQDNFNRIYYVKQIHENALLVISFYTAELKSVFDNPEIMKDMSIRLTDGNYNILYSSESDELGLPLSEDLVSRVADRSSVTVLDKKYLVTVNTGNDNWFVICSVPTKIILKEKNVIQLFIYMIAAVAAILAAIIGAVLSVKLTKPIEQFVSKLDTKAHIDQLTGILNKRSFEEYTDNRLNASLSIEHHALIILDLDNFKNVNDTLGHAAGDQVLANVGSILRATFSTEDYLGRIGGDEFCVFLNLYPDDSTDYQDFVISKCEALCNAFHNNYAGEDNSFKISASIGVSLFPACGKDFETLYHSADKALYQSKKSGKDTYTIFSEMTEKGEEKS